MDATKGSVELTLTERIWDMRLEMKSPIRIREDINNPAQYFIRLEYEVKRSL